LRPSSKSVTSALAARSAGCGYLRPPGRSPHRARTRRQRARVWEQAALEHAEVGAFDRPRVHLLLRRRWWLCLRLRHLPAVRLSSSRPPPARPTARSGFGFGLGRGARAARPGGRPPADQRRLQGRLGWYRSLDGAGGAAREHGRARGHQFARVVQGRQGRARCGRLPGAEQVSCRAHGMNKGPRNSYDALHCIAGLGFQPKALLRAHSARRTACVQKRVWMAGTLESGDASVGGAKAMRNLLALPKFVSSVIACSTQACAGNRFCTRLSGSRVAAAIGRPTSYQGSSHLPVSDAPTNVEILAAAPTRTHRARSADRHAATRPPLVLSILS